MDYERVNWENLPSTKTPVKADNLNKMDAGIKDLETELSKKANTTDISKIKEEITALQTENSRLKGITNALPKISGEDTSLTLTNTANAPLSDIILKGNTSQQKYSGKNLFQTLNYSNSNWLGYSINADTKYIIISGSNTRGAMLIEAQNKIYTLKANTTYTLTLFYISGDITSGNLTLSIQDWKNSDYPKFYTPSITSKNKKNVSITFTTDSTERTYKNCGVYLNNLTCSNLVVACQLEINSTATSYEQYVGGMPSPNPDYPQEIKVVTGDNTITISNSDNTEKQELPISLGSLELCKIGKYQDYFYKRGSKWYLHKEIEKVVLNGSENWDFSGSIKNNISYQLKIKGSSTFTPTDKFFVALNSHFTLSNVSLYGVTDVSLNGKFTVLQTGNNIVTRLVNKDISSVADLKTWLSTNNVILYWQLKIPTNTEITDTTLISQLNALYNAYTYNDTTNISQTNANLPFIINAEALKQEKLTAGTGIEITGENIINNIQANYSTEETKIGTWIDGKPLYRKTFNITSGFSTSLDIPHNISNIDYCKCYGTLINTERGTTIEQFYASSTDHFRCFREGNVVKIRYGTGNEPTTIIINLEYTKTTD